MTEVVKAALGRLERVDLRLAWEHEALQFTPWLAQPDNITLLGEAIHLDLEVQTSEVPVGPFSADILCKDTLTGHYVLIENQLERTDHSHLGQLLTYAAGLDAVTIVWIAARFTDEHRAALDWLNRSTAEGLNFFGLELEVWRIGDSPLAPKFNVVSQPNDWAKTAREAAVASGPATGARALFRSFWTQFKQFLEDNPQFGLRIGTPTAETWNAFPLGRSEITLDAAGSTRERVSWVGVRFHGDNAKAHYGLIKDRHRQRVEDALGAVIWRDMQGRKEAEIRIRRELDPTDESNWGDLNPWLAETLSSWTKFFRPLVATLDAAEWVGTESEASAAIN